MGRRCPKQTPRYKMKASEGESMASNQIEPKPQAPAVMRLRGGPKSSSSEMEVTVNDQQEEQGTSGRDNERSKRTHGSSPQNESNVTPLNPNKIRKEKSVTPRTPNDEFSRTSSCQRRARELTIYFERFKATAKKKLNATNNSDLDKGVTELCLENIHHVGRYTELKRLYEETEETKKRVVFTSPLPPPTHRKVRMEEENVTTDTETEARTRSKRPKAKKKKKNAVTNDNIGSASEARTQTEATDTERATSGTDMSRPLSLTSRSRRNKEKEKEILDKYREQAATVKYIVGKGDKTTAETKKLLWSQVVSKNKAPKIKNSVTLSGGDLMIIPADDETRAAMETLFKEGFGIEKRGSFLPKVIIYYVDKDITPNEIPKMITERNPEIGLTSDDIQKITPKFKRGMKDKEYVQWVCKIRPETYKKIVDRSIYLGYSVCRVREFLDVSICYRYQKYGHIAAKCKAIEMTYSHCAEKGHHHAECTNKDKPAKCVNCGEASTSHHRSCMAKVSKV